MRSRFGTLATVAMVVLAVASLAVAAAARPAAVRAATHSVSIVDFAFNPGSMTVNVGDTVVWTNTGEAPHTATSQSGPAAFDSGRLETGQTFSFTFTVPGTYSYICSIHPEMQGTITVAAAPAQPAPPAGGGAPAQPPAAAPGGAEGATPGMPNSAVIPDRGPNLPVMLGAFLAVLGSIGVLRAVQQRAGQAGGRRHDESTYFG